MPSSQSLLICGWILLCFALQLSNGMFDDDGVIFLVLAWGATVSAVWVKASGRDRETTDNGLELGIALMAALAFGYLTPLADYIHGQWYQALWRVAAGAMLALTAVTLATGRGHSRFFPATFYYGLVFAFGMRILMLVASPNPVIDVFPMFQESARHLFAGANPYATPVPDAYAASRAVHDYGYNIFGYAYLPLNLLIEAPFWALFRDVRAAHIACEMVAAGAILLAAKGSLRARWAVLLFLFMPRGLFVIEEAWTEPLIVAAFALATLAAERRPDSRWLAVAYGLMLGLKQYLIFFVVHGLMIERRFSRMALAGAVALGTVAPFVIWDWRAFLEYGVLFQLRTPFRPDALTLSSVLFAWKGIEIAKWFSACVGLIVSGATFAALRRFGVAGWRLSAILTTFSIFMFGSQGFANYYYFVAALMTFHLALEPVAPEKVAAPAPALVVGAA